MSAELLRETARQIRSDVEAVDGGNNPFLLALADWFDFLAPFGDQPKPNAVTVAHAIKVAHGYYGRDD